jgi:acetyl-CoA C-acetyltransferase
LANVVLTGGFESMTNIPHYIYSRNSLKYGDGKILDGLSTDGLLDAYSNSAMGVCAEKTVKDFQISRQ